MNYEEFAADLPLDQTLSFTSAEENQETMLRLGVEQRVRQVGRGRFRSDMIVRTTEQAEFFSDRFSTACTMYLEPPRGMVELLVFRSAGERFLASGHEVANDRLVLLPDGVGADLVLPDLAGSEAIGVPKEQFVEMMEQLCPRAKMLRLDRMTVIDGDPERVHALRDAVLQLTSRPERETSDEEVSNLLAATIVWLAESSGEWRPEGVLVNGARKRVAKLAQEYIEDHYRDSVHIEELCGSVGVGVRTLQRCFREYFDLTLTEYIETVRFDSTLRALGRSDPSNNSVSRVAVENGFTHLGRFSVEFGQRFGKSPRDVLAQPRA